MKKKRIKKWNKDNICKLDNETFIEIATQATMDRSIIKTSNISIENKNKSGAPPESIDLILKETERRHIPLSVIAEKFVDLAKNKKSFFGMNFVYPKKWKRYEIHVADVLIKLLNEKNVDYDSYDFDAKSCGCM